MLSCHLSIATKGLDLPYLNGGNRRAKGTTTTEPKADLHRSRIAIRACQTGIDRSHHRCLILPQKGNLRCPFMDASYTRGPVRVSITNHVHDQDRHDGLINSSARSYNICIDAATSLHCQVQGEKDAPIPV
jgi:hypothetical protein